MMLDTIILYVLFALQIITLFLVFSFGKSLAREIAWIKKLVETQHEGGSVVNRFAEELREITKDT